MIGPIARIIARYAAGALLAKGALDAATASQLAGDADVVAVLQMIIGGAVGGITEGFYYLARKFGWSK